MRNKFSSLLIALTLQSIVWTATPLWELGVVIDNKETITYQREVHLDTVEKIATNQTKSIKALHSNNFIPPIFKEIKNPINKKRNITRNYDDIMSTLTIGERILSVKKLFLNKKFIDFFSLYKSIEQGDKQKDPSLDIMYIQNLYLSNKYKEASKFISKMDRQSMSAEILLYKIKIDIKLKRLKQAQNNITEFIENYKDSDLMQYVLYEQKLLERNNDK